MSGGATFGPAPPRDDEHMSEGRKRQLKEMQERNHRLTVDGRVVADGVTYAEAQAAIPEDYRERWSIDKVLHTGLLSRREHLFNRGFGYVGGTTSTADLARMGVPVHPTLINEQKR